MKKVAKFEKVSLKQFCETYPESNKNVSTVYDEIKLPQRATVGSAGYDFYSTMDFTLNPGESIKIPTGIRVKIEEGWVLKIYPRSSLGFKYRLQLDNSTGIIDSDYYNSDNEGHIFIKITNDSRDGRCVSIKRGEAFAQGVFVEYGITIDDEVDEVRNGGFGSTDKQ